MRFLLSIIISIYSAQSMSAPTLSDVRRSLEQKDADKAVSQLLSMYPRALQNDADIARVGKWLSVFLYDETVASYEKAIELAGKNEASAQEHLQKALLKEPHNKTLRQAYVAYLIDHDKKDEALQQIADAEKKYPYFKIYSIYRRYLTPEAKKAGARDLKVCQSTQLSADEMDFCRAVFFREAAINKIKGDKKWIDEGKSLRYPDALYSLWEMTSSMEYLKHYITKCQGLTDQEKQSARLFPGVCSKVKDVEPLLKTEEPEE